MFKFQTRHQIGLKNIVLLLTTNVLLLSLLWSNNLNTNQHQNLSGIENKLFGLIFVANGTFMMKLFGYRKRSDILNEHLKKKKATLYKRCHILLPSSLSLQSQQECKGFQCKMHVRLLCTP